MSTKKWAVVKKWKDNPTDVQVLEYFADYESAEKFADDVDISELYDCAVMRYDA